MQVEKELKYCKRGCITFNCNAENITACQCSTVSISTQTKKYLYSINYNYLCANCLIQLDELVIVNFDRIPPSANNFIEGKHFYKENGYFVFTELYHFLKGTCCGNNCRHCAYGNSKN